MKKTVLYSFLVLIAIAASIYFVQIPSVEEAPAPIANVEAISPNTKEKVSIWASDDSRGYYHDALDQAFEKAKLDNPVLSEKVKQWDTLYDELNRQSREYAEVIELYRQYDELAMQAINQLNDSTQAPALKTLLLSLDEQAELKLAIERVIAIDFERKKLNDYLIALKIESTVPYFENAVTFAEDEATRFEGLQTEIQGFLTD
ncbi:MAG: hypothetical protein AB8H47_20720 [Bacteroidia bacterium]